MLEWPIKASSSKCDCNDLAITGTVVCRKGNWGVSYSKSAASWHELLSRANLTGRGSPETLQA